MAGVFEDNDGNSSSMRIVWTVAVLTIIFVWAYISIKTLTFQNFTLGDAGWFLALFSGKVGQKYVEANMMKGPNAPGA